MDQPPGYIVLGSEHIQCCFSYIWFPTFYFLSFFYFFAILFVEIIDCLSGWYYHLWQWLYWYSWFEVKLGLTFSYYDLVVLWYFLGIELFIHRGASLYLERNTCSIFNLRRSLDVRAVDTLIDSTVKLNGKQEALLPDVGCYRCHVGNLININGNCPEITYGIRVVVSNMHSPLQSPLMLYVVSCIIWRVLLAEDCCNGLLFHWPWLA